MPNHIDQPRRRLVCRNIRRPCVLAQLKSPDISRDRPAILDNHLGVIGRHRPIPFRDHLEQIPKRSLPQTLGMERCRGVIPTLDDHSLAIANAGMTRRAINIEPLLATCQHLHGHRKWHRVARLPVQHSGRHVVRILALRTRHRSLHLRPRGTSVRIQRRSPLRNHLGLVVHIVSTTHAEDNRHGRCQRDRTPACRSPASPHSPTRRDKVFAIHQNKSILPGIDSARR